MSVFRIEGVGVRVPVSRRAAYGSGSVGNKGYVIPREGQTEARFFLSSRLSDHTVHSTPGHLIN